MKKLAILLLVAFCAFPLYATTLERGISPAIEEENHPEFVELYRIKIENKAGGAIEISQDEYGGWKAIGKVLYPTQKINEYGYSAAKWVRAGKVAATAVNAIHIKVGAVDWERSIFSILPKDFLQPPAKYRSYLSPNSSIYTDISAGDSIFGGGFAPYVGNTVMLLQPARPMVPLPPNYIPEIGDVFYIIVDRPVHYPEEMVFENRFGGRILIKYPKEKERVIAQVLRPVLGIGRFEGSKFLDPGRIRANHAGVIDISVSPQGSFGGFQIVPALHGEDMGYVKEATQWMVIGPADASDPSLEGMAPFFKYFLKPAYRVSDFTEEDWEERLLSRFLVEVKFAGDLDWRPMPVMEIDKFYLRRKLPREANSVLKAISHFRIVFPVD